MRCFEFIDLEFDLSGSFPPWTILVGDNAAGKTTLLRSIAIGLCDESSAAGLLKESDTGYIRRGEKEAEIVIEFASPNRRSRRRPKDSDCDIAGTWGDLHWSDSLKRLIRRFDSHGMKSSPAHTAQGVGLLGPATLQGTPSSMRFTTYSITARGLQNPELTIRRLMPRKRASRQGQVLRVLAELLSLDGVNLDQGFGSGTGIRIDASWAADIPLRDLADGYKSTFLWVSDFLGWALDAQSEVRRLSDIAGVVLVDELEQTPASAVAARRRTLITRGVPKDSVHRVDAFPASCAIGGKAERARL